jgi:hypothetical protein
VSYNVAQAGFKLLILLPYLLRAEIIGMDHHAWLSLNVLTPNLYKKTLGNLYERLPIDKIICA